MTVEEELQTFFHCLQSEQARGPVRQYMYALTSGDEDHEQLAQILTRLGNARAELHLRISVVNVGLVGNLQDDFQVAWRTLERTNTLLRHGLGVTLALAKDSAIGSWKLWVWDLHPEVASTQEETK